MWLEGDCVMRKLFVALLCLLVFPGCATMIRGTHEQLALSSTPPGASATLSNGQSCTTPCSIKLARDWSGTVTFAKAGCQARQISVYPSLAGSGVILGGVIDYGDGAVYNLQPNPASALLQCPKTVSRANQPSSGEDHTGTQATGRGADQAATPSS